MSVRDMELKIEYVPTSELVPSDSNAKLHPHSQVDQIAASIEDFDFSDPIAVWHDENGDAIVVEGHGRLMAAKKLGISELPVMTLDHLDREQARAYTLVHNKLTMNSPFDHDALLDELSSLSSMEMERYGFDEYESVDVDSLFDEEQPVKESKPKEPFVAVCPKCGHENVLED